MIGKGDSMIVKCQWCGVKDTDKKDMKFEMVGEKTLVRKNYHENCYEEHLKDKAFKEKETAELDELRLVIERIYGLTKEPLPSQAYPFLNRIRNGEQTLGKNQKMGKRYKEGYTYPLIKEAYEYCSDTIEYWNSAKDFNGFMQAFKYGLAIVLDKIYTVEQKVKLREKQRALIEKHVENMEENEEEFVTSYKKPSKTKADISDFLD
jgi:hypothetical protein